MRLFPYGLVLSLPLTAILLYVFFSGRTFSNDAGNALLLIVFVIGVLSFPGSLALFLVGYVAAFAGKTGGLVAMVCLVFSVPNAHVMGMIWARAWLKASARQPPAA